MTAAPWPPRPPRYSDRTSRRRRRHDLSCQQRRLISGGSLTAPEPALPSAPTMPGGGAGPGAWPARRRVWIAIAAAGAVVAAGVISYLLLAGGHNTPSPTPQAQVLPPPCTTKSAKASVLPG